MTDVTIRIWHENLHIYRSGEQNTLPLSQLSLNDHIHGRLRIEIAGRQVPHLSYLSDDDTCFAEWLRELHGVAEAFLASQDASYLYDEGEEYQPAFLFERHGELGFLSIVDSQLSGGQADSEWQRVEFSVDEFIAEYRHAYASLCATLKKEAPVFADQWLCKRGYAIPE